MGFMQPIRILWQSVGQRWALLPTSTAAVAAFAEEFGISVMIGDNGIPINWAISVGILASWIIGGLLMRATRLQQEKDLRPVPDLTLRDAIDYIVNDASSGIIRKEPHVTESGQTVYHDGAEHCEALVLLNEKANSGELQLFGRRDKLTPGAGHVFESAQRPIPLEFWSTSELDYVVLHYPINRPQTSAQEFGDNTIRPYTDLFVSKKQIMQIWPKKSLWRRGLDKLYGQKRIIYPRPINVEEAG